MTRRVVITGMGVRAPGALSATKFWDLLAAGRTATRRMTLVDPAPFRSQVAAEVDFDATAEGLNATQVGRMDRATQFAVVCARDAMSDSGIDHESVTPYRLGVTVGSAIGATTRLEQEYQVLSDSGKRWLVSPDHPSPHLFDYLVPSMMPAEVAWTVGAEGPIMARRRSPRLHPHAERQRRAAVTG